MDDKQASAKIDDGDDLEKLLDLAEQYQRSAEEILSYTERYRAMQYMLLFFAALSIAALGFSVLRQELFSPSPAIRLFFGSGGFFGVLYAIIFERFIRRRRSRAKPDLIALHELVGLLRETEAAVASAEHWSPLKRAEFRIRLSRFQIGFDESGSGGFGSSLFGLSAPRISRRAEATRSDGAPLRTPRGDASEAPHLP